MGLELKKVGFTYLPGTPMSREVLRGIDLDLHPGEILCLMGRNGSGKSTLLQVMGGLLRPTCGDVTLDGRPAQDSRREGSALRRAVGILMQSPQKQLFAETVGKDVAFGPRNLGLSGEQLAQRVRTALLAVGMDPPAYEERSPFSLSEGEMRRAAMAGILAMQPLYLLLDEPFCGLDLSGRKNLESTLRALRQEGKGILLVTHDWEEVSSLADRVSLLSEGAMVLLGQKEEVITSERELRRAGLRPPMLVQLLSELRGKGMDLPAYSSNHGETAAFIAEAIKGRGR
jgi:energy-coupling factor transport system ATP-binding protein